MTSARNFRVSGFVQALAIKAPCHTFTTAPITLSGLQTVNGVALLEGERCLVKDQVDPVENGIYTAETSAWARDGDWDGARDVVGGTIVPAYRISDGLIVWYMVDGAPDTFIPGEDAVTFTLYFDSAGIPVSVSLQEVTDVGSTTDNTIETTTAGVKIDVRDGGSIRVRDAGDTDTISISHNGTNALIAVTNTTAVLFSGVGDSYQFDADVRVTGDVVAGSGNSVIAGNGADQVAITHDGTDGNIACVNTLDLNFTGATVGYKFSTALYLTEQTNANADFAGLGQIWVRDDAPNVLMFTDDDGTDHEVLGGGAGGTIYVIHVTGTNSSPTILANNAAASGWTIGGGNQFGEVVVTHNLGLSDANDLVIASGFDSGSDAGAQPEGVFWEDTGINSFQTQVFDSAAGVNHGSVMIIAIDVS